MCIHHNIMNAFHIYKCLYVYINLPALPRRHLIHKCMYVCRDLTALPRHHLIHKCLYVYRDLPALPRRHLRPCTFLIHFRTSKYQDSVEIYAVSVSGWYK